MRGDLDRAQIHVQVDIGFGDAVTPGPEVITFPVLLDDMSLPVLGAYPKATVIAEKLEAIVRLGRVNSRLKDYFDLWVLLVAVCEGNSRGSQPKDRASSASPRYWTKRV